MVASCFLDKEKCSAPQSYKSMGFLPPSIPSQCRRRVRAGYLRRCSGNPAPAAYNGSQALLVMLNLYGGALRAGIVIERSRYISTPSVLAVRISIALRSSGTCTRNCVNASSRCLRWSWRRRQPAGPVWPPGALLGRAGWRASAAAIPRRESGTGSRANPSWDSQSHKRPGNLERISRSLLRQGLLSAADSSPASGCPSGGAGQRVLLS